MKILCGIAHYATIYNKFPCIFNHTVICSAYSIELNFTHIVSETELNCVKLTNNKFDLFVFLSECQFSPISN